MPSKNQNTIEIRERRKHQKRVYTRQEVEELSKKSYGYTRLAHMFLDGEFDKKPPFWKIRKMTEVIRALDELVELYCYQWKAAIAELYEEVEYPNQNLRWQEQEDQILIQEKINGASMSRISKGLGRTPAACATRLSMLVGIPRGELVQMLLDGTLNGDERINGYFEGKAKRVSSSAGS